MKKGEIPPKGVKQLVIKLAGRNPRPTNRDIQLAVIYKFGAKLDPRTIVRYCQEVGLPTSGSPRGDRWSGEVPPKQMLLGHLNELAHTEDMRRHWDSLVVLGIAWWYLG